MYTKRPSVGAPPNYRRSQHEAPTHGKLLPQAPTPWGGRTHSQKIRGGGGAMPLPALPRTSEDRRKTAYYFSSRKLAARCYDSTDQLAECMDKEEKGKGEGRKRKGTEWRKGRETYKRGRGKGKEAGPRGRRKIAPTVIPKSRRLLLLLLSLSLHYHQVRRQSGALWECVGA